MALYLGSNKQKVSLGSAAAHANFYTTTRIVNGIALLSSEGYILKDSNGLYLTTKESE